MKALHSLTNSCDFADLKFRLAGMRSTYHFGALSMARVSYALLHNTKVIHRMAFCVGNKRSGDLNGQFGGGRDARKTNPTRLLLTVWDSRVFSRSPKAISTIL